MIGKILNVLGVIVVILFIGWILLVIYTGIAFVVANSVLLWIAVSVVALLILATIIASVDGKKQEAAFRKYHNAPELCPHKRVQITYHDYGAITFANKWCKICGTNLGPATPKK